MKLYVNVKSTARFINKHRLSLFGSILCAAFSLLVVTSIFLQTGQRSDGTSNAKADEDDLTVEQSPVLEPTPSPTDSPPPSPNQQRKDTKILFGIGSQAGPAMNYRLVKEAPVNMLSSWYNGPSDLEWMRVQINDAIKRVYAGGYTVHLVTWTDPQYSQIQTKYGPACGTPYPVSDQILEDMKQLAQIWKGPRPMYVTLFTEFQTYTCTNNTWNGNENYYNALKDNFRKIKDIFHQNAPGSMVAISWGGWQSRYDDPGNNAGRSFFPYFDDIMKESDFTAFQAMESDTNINEITDMVNRFSKFGKPIMVSHYKPANHSQGVFQSDMKWLFTDEAINQLTAKGLFAFSFMDEDLVNQSEENYQIVKNGIAKYGK